MMTLKTSQAAKAMAEILDWDVTNLKLHKMLYIAHMFFLGRKNKGLLDEAFEAWDYGPVLPSLYHDLKFFGSDKIMDIFQNHDLNKDTEEYAIIKEAAEHMRNFTSGQLVNITHQKGGAWAENYKPGIRNIKIPTKDIIAEYQKLYRDTDE